MVAVSELARLAAPADRAGQDPRAETELVQFAPGNVSSPVGAVSLVAGRRAALLRARQVASD